MAGCESRIDIEIEGGVDGFTVNAQMRPFSRLIHLLGR
jgi:hypothetical protein